MATITSIRLCNKQTWCLSCFQHNRKIKHQPSKCLHYKNSNICSYKIKLWSFIYYRGREKNARECEKKNKIKTNNDNIVSTSIVKISRKSEEYNLPVHSFINSSSIGMDHNFSVGFIKHTQFSDACILSACRCSGKI